MYGISVNHKSCNQNKSVIKRQRLFAKWVVVLTLLWSTLLSEMVSPSRIYGTNVGDCVAALPGCCFTLMLPTHPSVTGCTSLMLLIVHLPWIALLSAITTISCTSTFRTILDLLNPCGENWLETM